MREKLSWTDRGRSELLNLVKCFFSKISKLRGFGSREKSLETHEAMFFWNIVQINKYRS